MPAYYLPPELWMCVVESLYHDYQGEYPRLNDGQFSPTSAALVALANLCRVSKCLNHIATRLLYRMPFAIGYYKNLLLQTLVTCPKLSRHVRELPCIWAPGVPRQAAEYLPAFRESFRRRMDYVKHLDDDEHMWSTMVFAPGTGIRDQIRDAALIGLLPNLASVSLYSYHGPVCFGLEPDSLPSLTLVHVYYDLIDLYLEPKFIKHLAEAAPNIDLLHLHIFGADWGERDFPLFPNVTTLILDSPAIVEDSWPDLLQAFPRLETLSCSWGEDGKNNNSATVREIQDAVVMQRPSLKRLCVDAAYIKYFDDVLDVDRGFDHGLTSLRELEYLITDLTCIGEPMLEENGEDLGHVWGIWLEILPDSLRGLQIFADNHIGGLIEALHYLAQGVPVQSPLLEKISISWPKSEYIKLDYFRPDIWEAMGVELTLCVDESGGSRSKVRPNLIWP